MTHAVAAVLSLLLVAGLLEFGATRAGAAPATAQGYDIRSGPNRSAYAVLSFDDCPRSATEFKQVINAAEKLNIELVLFPTGNCLRSGRFSVSYARRHGAYVFNHTVSHPNLTGLSTRAVERELSAPGVVTNYGRAPYGALNSRVRAAYRAKGMRIWLWNVDTNDWRGKSRSAVVRYVIDNTHRGQTVLMHMQWNGFSATALRQMKSGLARKGVLVCRNHHRTTPVRLEGQLPC